MLLAIFLFSSCRKDPVEAKNTVNPLISAKNGEAPSVNKKSLATNVITVVGPITLNNKSNLIIQGDSINGGTKACITLNYCSNIKITNCRLVNTTFVGISLYKCTSIKIDSNYIGNVGTGIYVLNSSGIQIVYNQMQNIQGPYPMGQFIQFDNVTGAGNKVQYNRLENILGYSNPEDAISMYQSSGISTDPISIYGNWIRGGGPSQTGGGIMLGDGGGNYQIASSNILVNPGQYGMAISGGSNMQIVNNSIYSISQPFSNVGLYYWNQTSTPGTAITISGNKVRFYNGIYGYENDFWLGTSAPNPIGWLSNIWGANINSTLLPATIITRK